MRKLLILFFVVLVLGSTFFCLPAALAAESEDVEQPIWIKNFPEKVDTMNYTQENPYTYVLNTDIPYSTQVQYLLRLGFGIGVDGGNYLMRQSDQTTFYTDQSSDLSINVYWLGSQFPAGSIGLDPDTHIGYNYSLYTSNNNGKLTVHFDLYAPSSGYPATIGEIDFQVSSFSSTRVNAYWLNYQSSGVTASTDYLTPVAYFTTVVGAQLPVDDVKYITKSDEWYTVLNVKPNTAPTNYYWYNSSGDYIGDSSYPVPAGYKDLILIAWYGDNLFYNQIGKLVNFWRSVSTARQQLGFTNGQSAGYNQGYNQGMSAGYNQGYSDGVAEGTPTSALGGIVQGVSGMLNIPLFGDFTLGGLIAIILGLCLLFLFLKIFAGG